MKNKFYILPLIGLSLVSLSGCGEGWSVVKVYGQVPYTEERTAGPGVAYVRTLMLPQKGPVLPLEGKIPPPLQPPPLPESSPLFDGTIYKK